MFKYLCTFASSVVTRCTFCNVCCTSCPVFRTYTCSTDKISPSPLNLPQDVTLQQLFRCRAVNCAVSYNHTMANDDSCQRLLLIVKLHLHTGPLTSPWKLNINNSITRILSFVRHLQRAPVTGRGFARCQWVNASIRAGDSSGVYRRPFTPTESLNYLAYFWRCEEDRVPGEDPHGGCDTYI